MKKCYSLLLALYYRMCSTDVYCSSKQRPVAPKEAHHHHFFVSGIGQKKTLSMQPKEFVAAQKMLKNRKPGKRIRLMDLLGFFIALGIYTPLEARVYCSQ